MGFVDSIEQLFIRIQANESGGYFSKEWVPINTVNDCLQANAADKATSASFSAALLKSCFVSKSQNNAGFLAAVLKVLGFVTTVAGKTNALKFDADLYAQWLSDELKLAKDGIETNEPDKKPKESNETKTTAKPATPKKKGRQSKAKEGEPELDVVVVPEDSSAQQKREVDQSIDSEDEAIIDQLLDK